MNLAARTYVCIYVHKQKTITKKVRQLNVTTLIFQNFPPSLYFGPSQFRQEVLVTFLTETMKLKQCSPLFYKRPCFWVKLESLISQNLWPWWEWKKTQHIVLISYLKNFLFCDNYFWNYTIVPRQRKNFSKLFDFCHRKPSISSNLYSYENHYLSSSWVYT